MKNMFSYFINLKNFNLSSFETYNFNNIGRMFYYCEKLITLNISSFKTNNVTNMEQIFVIVQFN